MLLSLHVCVQASLEQERQQRASLAAGMAEVASGLQSSGDAEGQLRARLAELAERVAVLTAAQVGWRLMLVPRMALALPAHTCFPSCCQGACRMLCSLGNCVLPVQ